jgi:hypothetical protein
MLTILFIALIFRPLILQAITKKKWDKRTDALVDYVRPPWGKYG